MLYEKNLFILDCHSHCICVFFPVPKFRSTLI